MSSLPVLCPPVCLLKVRDCPLAAITSCQAPSTCPPPSRRPPNFPPGLVRLPLVGHLPKGSKPNMEFWGTRKVMQENSGVARSLLRCWACSWATFQVFKYKTLHWPRIYSTGGWLTGKPWIRPKKCFQNTVWIGLKNPLYGQCPVLDWVFVSLWRIFLLKSFNKKCCWGWYFKSNKVRSWEALTAWISCVAIGNLGRYTEEASGSGLHQTYQVIFSLTFPREEWCGRGQSLISTYFRADKGKNRVTALLPHCPCSKEFCCSGNHNNRRPGMDRDQAIHLEASQGLRFWKSWVGRSDPGRGGLILPLDTFICI